MVRDAGYDVYASNVSVRPDKMEKLTPCLQKLIPMIQQTGKNYVNSPDAINKTITDWVSQDVSFSTYSEGEASYSAKILKEKGVIGPDAAGVWGGIDMAKAQESINQLIPVLNNSGSDLPAQIPANELYSTQFIDTNVK